MEIELKKKYLKERDKLFQSNKKHSNAYNFCVQYSLLVEEYLLQIVGKSRLDFSIVAVGSYSRRELAPYSDIDIMFIIPDDFDNFELINNFLTKFWDCGIEVSHTIRKLCDLEKFLVEDLVSFTQFFETRFLYGSKMLYNKWNKSLFGLLTDETRSKLILEYVDDVSKRHIKYGDSPKMLEPNIKFTAGGLRDLQSVEWMYSLNNNIILTDDKEQSQTENFLQILKDEKTINSREYKRIKNAYGLLLKQRNLLHVTSGRKNERFEFQYQELISTQLEDQFENWQKMMFSYFDATSTIHRFSRTMIKKYKEEITKPVSEYLTIELDEDFSLNAGRISTSRNKLLSVSSIMRAYYYRAKHHAVFDKTLRSLITDSLAEFEEGGIDTQNSSVFFREILNIPNGTADTLASMNELGVLGLFLPEFKELIGLFQPGIYHCYTVDEHTLVALKSLENLSGKNSRLGHLFDSITRKDLLYLAVLLHDIGKPISISGHEIIGAEITNTILTRLGYDFDEIELVMFLVRHHLTMEQTAFRRDLNDSDTLDNFSELIPSAKAIKFLYLLTYADLSAVSPVVWTKWKDDLLFELYNKTKKIIDERISGEELLISDSIETANGIAKTADSDVKKHVASIDDLSYFNLFTEDEITQHVSAIQKNNNCSVLFNEEEFFTNITVITKDSDYLLARLCGALAINDLNIHDAKIFTRKDGNVIDSFKVTDFRTGKNVPVERYDKIKADLTSAENHSLEIVTEFKKVKSKWKFLRTGIFSRRERVKVEFEEHNKFTIVDIFSQDSLGLLYTITKSLYSLDLNIYFAKIATQGDDVVDTFYIQTDEGKKISSNNYELIRIALSEAIEELLKR